MCKYWTVLAVIFSLSVRLSSVAQTTISGRVQAAEKTSLVGVSVLTLNSVDSSFISGAVTDTSGNFSIGGLKPASYILSFSLIGYKKQYVRVDADFQSVKKYIDIVLNEETQFLKGVTITGQREAFTYEGGKTTVNMSSAITGSDGTMLDALTKIPGVLIQSDGTVVLNGQVGANVMIDDKLTYLTGENMVNYLRSIPVSSIEKVELITQPSSRYDAVGMAGLINIQRKKKQQRGMNFIVNSSFEKGIKFRNNQSLAFSFHRNKMSLFADYAFNTGRNFIDITSTRDYASHVPEDFTELRLDMKANRQQHNTSHYIKSGIDYSFSKKLTAGVFISSNWFKRSKQERVVSDFYRANAVKDSSLLTNNIQLFSHSNVSGEVNMDYLWTDKLKWDASFNFQLFRQSDSLEQNSAMHDLNTIRQPDQLKGSTNGNIDIYSGQSNLTYDMDDRTKLSAGVKSAIVQINSDVLYNRMVEGCWQQDNRLSSGFLYREQINAAYLQMKRKWTTAFSTDLGLRLEHTRMSGSYAVSDKDSSLHRTYPNLFFTFQTQYRFSDNHQLFFQYGRRIVRPNYRDLNPFVEVNDRYLQEKGNTRLNPELIDNFDASWLIRQKFTLGAFYLNRHNPITKSFLLEDSIRTTTVLPMNLSDSYAAGIRMNINNLQPFRFWTVHINTSLTYKRFQWMEFDILYKNAFLTPTFQLTNQFSFPRNWSVDLTGFYTGKMAEGQAKTGKLSTVSAGLRKNMLANKFSMYIYVSDIFLTNRPSMTISNYFMQGYYKERRDSRMIGMTLTYRFSGEKPSKEIRREGASDEEKRVTLP